MVTYGLSAIVTSAWQMRKLSDLSKLTSGRSQSLNQDQPAFKAHYLKISPLYAASLKSLVMYMTPL